MVREVFEKGESELFNINSMEEKMSTGLSIKDFSSNTIFSSRYTVTNQTSLSMVAVHLLT